METDEQMPSTSSTSMETEDIVPSTSAVPFVVPHTTSTARTNAQRQREYRLRQALTRTPEQVRAFKKAAAERQRKFKLRKSANIALTSGTSESPASTSCSVVERTSVPVVAKRTSVPLTNAQRQRAFRQRRAASSRTDVQPNTSSTQTAIQLEQSTWCTKWSSSIRRFQSTFLDNDFGHACSVCDRLWFKNDLKTITALQLKAVQDHGARKTGNILCPNCNTEIQIPQNKEDKVNAMIVNVYQYFAKEGTGLTGAQLRQRTALCTGASEADVECALVLEHEKSTDEGNPAMSQNPPRKRRRKGSESPPPEQEEEPYVEQETLIVKIEPNADDGSNEINPLAIDEETPPYSMTEPGHICLKDGSCCNPLQIQPNVINAATVFVKEEPKEETNAAMSQSYQPKQSDNKGPTPDNPLDSCSHIKTEEINIEDSCCSDTDSEGYS
ncbi:uncharacterized protein LOC111351319 isoform X2 [Spodoptera litura]|uniref:Uncharacterized protein LOC111351319 isoform X2 n=1 Tax=Spodoptera litura TaxID=69820 RepID=A0A9J7E0C1_SPOLT|nr:uncharacterized protein LOC111351319 isoform X2 [Spodoptera litura]